MSDIWGALSTKRCCLTSTGIPIIKIRLLTTDSYFYNGNPWTKKDSLNIETGSSMPDLKKHTWKEKDIFWKDEIKYPWNLNYRGKLQTKEAAGLVTSGCQVIHSLNLYWHINSWSNMATCSSNQSQKIAKNWGKYLQVSSTSYFWTWRSFQMFTGFYHKSKVPLLRSTVLLKAPQELWNPLSKAVPAKFHRSDRHSKQIVNCF